MTAVHGRALDEDVNGRCKQQQSRPLVASSTGTTASRAETCESRADSSDRSDRAMSRTR